jgi:hypothetical protein
MAYAITVPYNIVFDSGAQSSGVKEGVVMDSGPWAEVKFKCAWVDHYQMINDLLGTWIVAGLAPQTVTPIWAGGSVASTPFVIRQPPLPYEPAPALFCTDIVSIDQLGKPGFWSYPFTYPWLTGQIAVVTARFGIPGWTPDGSDQSGQPYTRLGVTVAAEFLTFPDTTYLINGTIPTFTPQGVIMPQIEFSWTRVRMPYIPDAFMASIAGCVNADTFQVSRSFIAPVGTLLFMPGQVQEAGYAQALGLYEYGYPLSYTVEYKFMFRPMPWNYVCAPLLASTFGSVFYPVYGSGTGNTPYPTVNFTGIFP